MGFCFLFSYYFSRTTVAVILPLDPSASTIDCGKSNVISTLFSPSLKSVKSIGFVVTCECDFIISSCPFIFTVGLLNVILATFNPFGIFVTTGLISTSFFSKTSIITLQLSDDLVKNDFAASSFRLRLIGKSRLISLSIFD